MRLKRTEYGCSPIARTFQMLLPEETFAVLEGEFWVPPEDEQVGNDYLRCCLSGIASGGLIRLYQCVSRNQGHVFTRKNNLH